MTSDAIISECGTYRYSLRRFWLDHPRYQVTFVMLNPSTANAMEDDPTIRRCVDYAKRWGFSSLEVVNLFAQRTSDPKNLWTNEQSIGPENDKYIDIALKRSQLVVCAWGVPKWSGVLERSDVVFEMIKSAGKLPHYLRVTKDGFPSHPLYLPKKLEPQPCV